MACHARIYNEAAEIVRTNSESVGEHAETTGRRLGIDVATGQPLLTDGETDKE